MADRAETTLMLGGEIHGGWTSVAVKRGIEAISGGFTVEATERWPDRPERRTIRPGESCRLAIGGEVVLTGFVDDVKRSYDKESHTVTVTGRDATADLVDCSALGPPVEWINMPIGRIAAEVCEPFGVSVSLDGEEGPPFERVAIEPGETVFALIARLAKHRALLTVTDGLGNLSLTRAGRFKAAGRIAFGENAIGGEIVASDKERYSEIVVRGQGAGLDLANPAAKFTEEGRFADPGIERRRPLLVLADTYDAEGFYQKRAEWEVRARAGRGRRFVYRVQGWRDASGALWTPNTMVRVTDPMLDVDEDLVLAAVENKRGGDGTTSTLELAPREAFELFPLPKKGELPG